MSKWIDLRSDTVTLPTNEMRKAMANAEVGDDVYGEDVNVNRLQELAAEKMGKESGLFVPSGTMGNLIAALAHCGRGDEAIMGSKGHTFIHEAGGMAALGGIHPYPIPNQPDGTLSLDDIRSAIRTTDIHHPVTKLIILENTQNQCGGLPLSVEYTNEVGNLASQYHLALHLDGARIFNAAVSQYVTTDQLAQTADSVTFCLSKGLCAPVGSVLCGSRDFIQKATHIRKQLGGGMRQAGILAAAGILAIEKMVSRLSEDHHRAQLLADSISTQPYIKLDNGSPATNMIFFELNNQCPLDAQKLSIFLLDYFIKIDVINHHRIRLVTHKDISDRNIRQVAMTIDKILSAR